MLCRRRAIEANCPRSAPVPGRSMLQLDQHVGKSRDPIACERCCARGRAMSLRFGSRSEACRRYLGRQRPFDALVPPHPGPLPWGEGESSAACSPTRASQECSGDGVRGPLSPRERVGVRGKGAIGLLYRLKTTFAPPDNVTNLSGIARGRAHSGAAQCHCPAQLSSAPRSCSPLPSPTERFDHLLLQLHRVPDPGNDAFGVHQERGGDAFLAGGLHPGLGHPPFLLVVLSSSATR